MRESEIQRKIILFLESHGWLVVKIIQCNKNGWPDLEAIRKFPEKVYIEVKRPSERPEPLQEYRMKKLREMGWTTIVARSVEDVKHLN
jgi:Holliday junction resolvase